MIRLNQIIIQTNPDFCSTIENRLFSSVSSLTGSLKLVTQNEEKIKKPLVVARDRANRQGQSPHRMGPHRRPRRAQFQLFGNLFCRVYRQYKKQ